MDKKRNIRLEVCMERIEYNKKLISIRKIIKKVRCAKVNVVIMG